eukprot:3041700-Rhodomonas_salina.2
MVARNPILHVPNLALRFSREVPYPSMRCAIDVRVAVCLRAGYAMRGTDTAYGARYAMPGTVVAYGTVCLRPYYAASGTEIAYVYLRAMRSAVLRSRMLLPATMGLASK